MQRALVAFTVPVPLPLAPAINMVLAAFSAAGPAAHHAIHRKRRIALSPAARPVPARQPGRQRPAVNPDVPGIYLAWTRTAPVAGQRGPADSPDSAESSALSLHMLMR